MLRYLHRYQQGQCEQVWAELLELGDRVREDSILPDARAVAHETMARILYNIRLIVPRLGEVGYELHNPLASSNAEMGVATTLAFTLPPANTTERLKELEGLVGPLPLSLEALYQTVGSVNLVGRAPDRWVGNHLAEDYKLDPLFIYPLEVAMTEYQEWSAICSENPKATYSLPISPDHYHKYGISGGMWYHVNPPIQAVDTIIQSEPHNTTLVNYLRICFRWGGLPGLEYFSRIPRLREPIHRDLDYLTKGTLPI